MQQKGFVYHLVPPEVWEKAMVEGRYTVASLKTEGFVHMSTEAQLFETAAVHLGQYDELIVLRLPVRWRKDKLKWEESRDGALFPHYYGPLELELVEQTMAIEKQSDGSFAWQQ